MRLLLDESGSSAPGALLDASALARVYAAPPGPWLRVNFVSTLDGAATGTDGRSGSINTEADGVVFDLLRRLSDVVLVGAGTVRAEGYERLREQDGAALLVTCAAAPQEAVSAARDAMGDDAVLICGDHEVDLRQVRGALEARGMPHILSEGGPSLFRSMLTAGVVDELDLTWSPRIVGGEHPRITSREPLDVSLRPMAMVEADGTVMGRWRVLG